MVPDGQAMSIRLQVGGQPVGNQEKLFAALGIGGAAPEIVVAQSKLRDGDGIVLQADLAVIVELRNAGWIVSAAVVGFLGEEHVVLTEFPGSGVRIFGGSFVPEREMAFAAEDVGAKDTPVVGEGGHGAFPILRYGCGRRVEYSVLSTQCSVLSCQYSVVRSWHGQSLWVFCDKTGME